MFSKDELKAMEQLGKKVKDAGNAFGLFYNDLRATTNQLSKTFARFHHFSKRPRWRMMAKTGRNRQERKRDQVKLRGQRRNRRS